jgi:hypothetical protein
MPGMMDRPTPPMAPDVQSQGASGFGSGVGQAQSQMGKSPVETAVMTVEKLLNGIQDETFRPYAAKAIASLKLGMAMMQQKQPVSGMQPPQMGGAPPQIPTPPVPGQMPV